MKATAEPPKPFFISIIPNFAGKEEYLAAPIRQSAEHGIMKVNAARVTTHAKVRRSRKAPLHILPDNEAAPRFFSRRVRIRPCGIS